MGTTNCLLSVPPPPATLYVYDVCPSITELNFASTNIGSTSTITLPIYSSPNFIAVAPSATTAYVTLPDLSADPTNPQTTIVPSVGIVSIGTTTKALVGTVPVVSTPAGGTPALTNPVRSGGYTR